MNPCKHVRPRTGTIVAGIIAVLFVLTTLFCGCLQVEPEELPPQTTPPFTATTVSLAVPQPVTTSEETSAPPAIAIISPKQTGIFTEEDFPAGVEDAVNDFAVGKTSDAINGFLRYESVRARTSQEDADRIREQIRAIDYAVFNTTLKENSTVYVGISGEQARRIQNESVFFEKGYSIGSYDPSVVYRKLANTGRDSGGYLTMCVIDFRKGSHILFVNATEREFLIPRDGIWDFAREETREELEFSKDSVPRYRDIIPTKVRLIYTKEHP